MAPLRRFRFLAIAASLLLSAVVGSVRASEELILEVVVERFKASQGVVAYQVGDRVLLPLGELAAALELAIAVDSEFGRASGWILTEDRTFELELEQGRVSVAGRQDGIPSGSVIVDDYDIYVASDVLSQWLPADFLVDLRGMRVRVEPREILPLVARLKRDQLRSQMLARRPGAILYPERRGGYRAAAWPFVDAEAGYYHDNAGDHYRGSLLGRGDLAHLSMNGFVSYRGGVDDDLRGWLRAGRTDPDGGLFGALAATEFAVGDIFTGRIPFVSRGKRGRGALVTNRRLGNNRSLDVTDIFGDAPPGWEVELYVNGNLYDFATADASGRYEFRDVQVYSGTNVVRTVLYGPQGQSREDVRSITIGPGVSKSGRLYYEAFTLQDEMSIFGGNLWNTPTVNEGIWNSHVELGYGVSRSFTLGASMNRIAHVGAPQDIASATAYKSLGSVLLQGIYASDLDAGNAVRLAGQGRLLRQRLFFEQNFFNDYRSEAYDTYEGATSETNARLSGGRGLAYHLRYRYRGFDRTDIRKAVQYQARFSASVKNLMLGHELDFRQNTGDNGVVEYGSGSQLVSGNWGRWRLKGDVGYGLGSHSGIQSAGATVQWRPTTRLNTQLSGRRFFQGFAYSRVDADVTWTLDRLLAGFSVGYNTQGSWRAGVSLATSLTRAPGTGEWYLSGTKSSNYGAALARTFVDMDGDGRFTAADEPLPGVTFRRNRRWQGVATNDDGLVFLAGLSPDRFQNIEIDLDTVEDPFLVPSHKGLTTLVHGGGVVDLEFPFYFAGEIEGLVVRDDAMTRPLRNIGLELLDASGQRVATAVSEFDGYYLFQRVRPGIYQLGIVATTVPGGDYLIPPPVEIVVPPRGDFVQGPVFMLERIGGEVEVQVAAAEPTPEPEPPVETSAPVQEETPPAGAVEVVVAGQPAAVDDMPAPTPEDRQVAKSSVSSQVVSATVQDSGPAAVESDPPAIPPDENRTLHLIYELLFSSELFADED